MKLSEKAWQMATPVIHNILTHPFNQALANGSLASSTFAYYLEQDSLYLKDFARCHALIAAKSPLAYVRQFLGFAESVFVAEQEVVHCYFKKEFAFNDTGLVTPATLSYTSYLLQTCSLLPVEVAVAAVLPCFWVYRETGCSIARDACGDNPFSRWIETYSSEEFSQAVDQAIAIFDALAAQAPETLKTAMLRAFYTSTCLEWHFWNDAYHHRVFDAF
ncbi:thiaminase II [Legionella sp. MW5194]|uniref:TenA family protein n=1 Tax=Legionella sp. MW5194 TaxID=2662448 RepID=UPI00193E560E|nr:TenA family protein [Legionella sp. MW5194]QRN03607.1 thiaminase II [Legionella sp. MW5194]